MLQWPSFGTALPRTAGRDKPVHRIVHVLISATMITLLDLCRKLVAQQLLICSCGSTSVPMADTWV